MSCFVIEGGHRLSGEIRPQGAKNEVLQILCAVLLTREKVTVHNVPDILDVNNLIESEPRSWAMAAIPSAPRT